MRRRAFITLAGAPAASWPLADLAKQAATPTIGFLSSRSPGEASIHTDAFRRGLEETGFVEGKNVAIVFHWSEGNNERLPALASELAKPGVQVIVAAGGSAPALAAKAATRGPIVFLMGDDPVKVGLVSSFNRPGGNITGFSLLAGELGAKRLSLLLALVPATTTVAVLLNPNSSGTDSQRQDVQQAANTLGKRLVVLYASNENEFDATFAKLVHERVGALVVKNDPFFDTRRDHLIALATRHAIPAIYHIREFPTAGGLMSYGASLVDAYRQVGSYTGRILKGEKPADLPVVQPTRFELVINRKTASSLGLAIPAALLIRADEVIG